jgi:hypothetical protein
VCTCVASPHEIHTHTILWFLILIISTLSRSSSIMVDLLAKAHDRLRSTILRTSLKFGLRLHTDMPSLSLLPDISSISCTDVVRSPCNLYYNLASSHAQGCEANAYKAEASLAAILLCRCLCLHGIIHQRRARASPGRSIYPVGGPLLLLLSWIAMLLFDRLGILCYTFHHI